MKNSLFAAVAAFAASLMPALAESVVLQGQVILGESKLAGEKIGEFSALVRSPDGSGVLAISDRGYIARLDVEIANGMLTQVRPVSVHVLTGPDETPLRNQGFNPEGAALLDDGTIAIVSEAGPRLAVFDAVGKWLRDEALPEAVQEASQKDGVGALAWTTAAGFLAMTEEPPKSGPRHVHGLHSTLAGSASFSTDDSDFTVVKGMETVGDQLFLIERTKDDVTKAYEPWLRVIDLPACLGAETCETRQLTIPVTDLPDADFEGLVALEDGTFVMVSDDKIAGALRSVFVLFRVQ